MKRLIACALFALAGCQSIQQKDALVLSERVGDLRPLSHPRYISCTFRTELSAPQAVKYRKAFSDETELVDNWSVTYDWRMHGSRCDVHAHPLTPMTANQRAFLDEALCTLLEVFWAHSPFDGIKTTAADVIDQDQQIFLRQRPDSDIGIYVSKKDFELETRTAHKGVFFAHYDLKNQKWLPSEIRHETATFHFALRDMQWNTSNPALPPSDFWIFVGEQGAPEAHTHVLSVECR